MRRVFVLYQSSVGKKVVMAVTGFFMIGFVVLHMLGNLKAFAGQAKFDHYAEFLREIGAPVLGHGQYLWIQRVVLLAFLILHVTAAIQLTRQSRAARPEGYEKNRSLSLTYASRMMRWGGVLLFLFIVYHILHFTVGSVHPEFVQGAAYHNLVTGLRNPLVAAVYIAAVLLLQAHLYHGVWSMFQTLGLNSPKWNHAIRRLAAVGAFVVAMGFLAIPISILAGIIK